MYSMEVVINIWNDGTGERITVGPDSDGLGLVQIRSILSDGKIERDIAMPKEQALIVAKAIIKLYKKD